MDPRLQQILIHQQTAGFPDLQGADASLTLPISDRLLNEMLASLVALPSQIRELQLQAHADNRIGVRIKPAGSFLPTFNLTVLIDRQPELPASPVLVLKLQMGGLMGLVGPALRFFDSLPRGIRVDGDRVLVDLAILAEQRGLGSWLAYLDVLRVDTGEGVLIVTLRAAVRGPRNP
jgi:hypothetical protein